MRTNRWGSPGLKVHEGASGRFSRALTTEFPRIRARGLRHCMQVDARAFHGPRRKGGQLVSPAPRQSLQGASQAVAKLARRRRTE